MTFLLYNMRRNLVSTVTWKGDLPGGEFPKKVVTTDSLPETFTASSIINEKEANGKKKFTRQFKLLLSGDKTASYLEESKVAI